MSITAITTQSNLIWTTILVPFALLGISEAIIKPIAIKVTQYGIRQAKAKTFQLLDERLQLPGQWEQFIKDKTTYLSDIVLPEENKSLTEQQVQQIVELIPKEFNLQTFLNKVK